MDECTTVFNYPFPNELSNPIQKSITSSARRKLSSNDHAANNAAANSINNGSVEINGVDSFLADTTIEDVHSSTALAPIASSTLAPILSAAALQSTLQPKINNNEDKSAGDDEDVRIGDGDSLNLTFGE